MATITASCPGLLAAAVSECVIGAAEGSRRDGARAQLRLDLERFVHSHRKAPLYLHDVGASRSRWWNDTRESRCQSIKSSLDRVEFLLKLDVLLAIRRTASDTLLSSVALMLQDDHSKAKRVIEADLRRFGSAPGADGLLLTAGLLAELASDWESAERRYAQVCQSERHQYRISALFARTFIRARSGASGIGHILRLIAKEDPIVVEVLGRSVVSTRARREGSARVRSQCVRIAREAEMLKVRSLRFLSQVG